MNAALMQAIHDVLGRPDVWLIIVASAFYGIFVGAIPGLTATMAVALFVPMAYWLDPVSAVAAIVTMVACAIFAGDLPTVLLRIPGTPASAAYADDAYAMARAGQARRLLMIALTNSVIGGVIGAICLMVLGSQLAKAARWFSVTEYFWLYLTGLCCAILVAPRGTRLKALGCLILGLLLSTIGLSAAHIEPRFTFGSAELYQGISFIPAMIGLFGLSEVFAGLGQATQTVHVPEATEKHTLAATLRQTGTDLRQRLQNHPAGLFRASSIGVLIGMLPGAGADIAAWVSFAASRRSRPQTENATESLIPIADATAANSAALAGGWIPALVFGIPGDSVTAIVIGVLLMKNVTPGPDIFVNQASLVYSIYLVFLLANLLMLPIGFLAVLLSSRIVLVPRRILLPMIVLFCITGSYALNGSLFDVGTMLVMGLLGFGLSRYDFPPGPVVLGLILGGPLEERLIQSLTAADGNLTGLVNRPIAILLACAFFGIIAQMIRGAWDDMKNEA
ncbi:MAG: tripartite tricarboxylate transporter permease [Planctomycetaceae bacterium]|nr:tripartite tricarboxylate transporter permease [Planctomycetaceae bacterium]